MSWSDPNLFDLLDAWETGFDTALRLVRERPEFLTLVQQQADTTADLARVRSRFLHAFHGKQLRAVEKPRPAPVAKVQ